MREVRMHRRLVLAAALGSLGPPGMPAELVQRIRAAFTAAKADEAAASRVAGLGLVDMGDPSPAEIQDFVNRETARWAPVVRVSAAQP
jgi:tripartite-type tricarboxylate transporter receptor subunit TctC